MAEAFTLIPTCKQTQEDKKKAAKKTDDLQDLRYLELQEEALVKVHKAHLDKTGNDDEADGGRDDGSDGGEAARQSTP